MTYLPSRPSLLTRARIALDVFRRGVPPDRKAKPPAAPFLWPAWREGHPQWHIIDLQSYINEGYNLNTLIYSCLMYKTRAVSIAPMRAYEGDPDHPTRLPPDAPLSRLVARPNPSMSWIEFNGLSETYFNLAGESFIGLSRPARGGMPVAMYPLRSDRVYIIPAEGGIRGYLYVPEGKAITDGVPYLPEDMLHIKLPNPGDPLEGLGHGLSPLSPIANSADVDNDVTRFLKKFFDAGTMVNVYLKFDRPMMPKDMDAARKRFAEVYGGWERWIEPVVMESGGTVEKFGFTFEEMGFTEIDERNESRIHGPFGVPPQLTGSRIGMKNSTYANWEESRKAFWEDTMTPEMLWHETEYQYYLTGNDGEFVAFDFSRVPALRKNVPALVTAAYQLWQMGETRNNAYAIVGIDALGGSPGGDTSYLPISAVPVGVDETPPQSDEGAASAEDDTRKAIGGNGYRPALLLPAAQEKKTRVV